MGEAGRRRRRPTDEWEQPEVLCRWPELVAYEEIRPLLLGHSRALPSPGLFALGGLENAGCLKALRLEDYAARRVRPEAPQQALFPYHKARG